VGPSVDGVEGGNGVAGDRRTSVELDRGRPVAGYREWALGHDDLGRPALVSVYHHIPWPRRGPFEAVCSLRDAAAGRDRQVAHAAPDVDCRCGIHAYARPGFARLPGPASLRIRGSVAGWGRVLPEPGGWRARFCRPRVLFELPGLEEMIATLARSYGAEVASEPLEVSRTA
jgi:hypothetical protein